MKKGISLFAMLFVAFMVAITGVKAENLDGKVNITNSLGVGDITFDHYDDASNVNYLKAAITVNQSSVDTVLAQQTKNSEVIGTFHLGINPTLTSKDGTFKSNSVFYKKGEIASALTNLNDSFANIVAENSADYLPVYLSIEYSTDGGATWAQITDKGDGSKTVADYLKEKTGTAHLVYGKDYRFQINSDEECLIGWEYMDALDATVYDYINITYDVNFPISVESQGGVTFFPTLKDAIASEFENINIKGNITIDEDLVLDFQDYKMITIEKGATLTIAPGVTLTNDGSTNINNYGKIVVEGTLKNDNYIYNVGEIEGNIESGQEGSLTNASSGVITGDLTFGEFGFLSNDGKITGSIVSDGDIYNSGEITGTITNSEGKSFFNITVLDIENGYIYTANMASVGSTVVLYPQSDDEEKYELGTLRVVYIKDGKEIEVEVKKEKDEYDFVYYTFVMPESDVQVSGNFVEIKSPNTYDGISVYYVAGSVSVIGMIGLAFYLKLKKRMN